MTSSVRGVLIAALLLVACAEAPPATPAMDAVAAPVVIADTLPVPTQQPATFASRDSIVFAWTRSEAYLSIEPIYQLDANGVLTGTPSDLITDDGRAFADAHFAPGARFTLTRGGRRVDVAQIDSAIMVSCVGIGAEVRIERDPYADSTMSGVAYVDPPAEASWLFEATTGEDSAARALAGELLRHDSIPTATIGKMEWSPAGVVSMPNGGRHVVIGGDYWLHRDAELPMRVFVVMDGRTGLPLLANAGGQRRIDSERPSLFDAADLDVDGTPELIVRNRWVESWTYTIYRYGPEGWMQIFDGGGSGC